MNTSNLEALVAKITNALPQVKAVYVFGSVAKGLVRGESDLDLAILTKEKIETVKLWLLAQELSTMVGCDVDLLDLRAASAVMRMQVIGQGRRLFCADLGMCEGFEDFVFSDYARLNEERAAILADMQDNGAVYG